jgi:D-3-phosphoglycerate dehydrogenase
MNVPLLLAGDDFVTNEGLARALRAHCDFDIDLVATEIPWPVPPFGEVAEVTEASGSEDQMIEALRGRRGCVTQMAPLTRRVFEASPQLELVAVARGGPVNVNLAAAEEHGVTVTSAPGRNAEATAEHTLAMILAASRRIPHTHVELRAGRWRSDLYAWPQVGQALGDSTVGIVGFGAIGRRIAELLAPFGAEVLVHDPYLPDDGGTRSTALDELLARSNVLTLHARLTPETAGLVGRRELALLPDDAIVVNCARGGLLDYDALCDELDSGRLFGAAVDVFPEEPLPYGSRLLRTPNLVMTPHLAGASRRTALTACDIVAQDVARFYTGRPVLHSAR